VTGAVLSVVFPILMAQRLGPQWRLVVWISECPSYIVLQDAESKPEEGPAVEIGQASSIELNLVRGMTPVGYSTSGISQRPRPFQLKH
jgi:hypothetical protein